MTDDLEFFDELLIAGDDDARPDGEALPLLVVAEKAISGEAMHDDEAAFLASATGLPGIVFAELDPETGVEHFGNAEAYRKAGQLTAPTMEEALAWEARVMGERLVAYYAAAQPTERPVAQEPLPMPLAIPKIWASKRANHVPMRGGRPSRR